MNKILNKLDPNKIKQAIGSKRINLIKSIIDDDLKKSNYAKIAYEIYGDTFLNNNYLRKECIKLLPKKRIDSLTKKYKRKVYKTKEAAAIQLSKKNWTGRNEFSLDLINALDLKMNNLPKRNKKMQISETVEPLDEYYDLFPYQQEIKNNIVKYILTGKRRFIVQLPTGAGKTKTTIEAIVSYIERKNLLHKGKSIIWITHSEELCEQAINTIKNVWKHTQKDELEIVRLWGEYKPTYQELTNTFIFSTYQKLCSKNSQPILRILSKNTKIVVVDEAHKSIAPTYSEMLNTICDENNSLIGLTATPGRSAFNSIDNIELAQFFNKNIINQNLGEDPIKKLREIGVLSELNHKFIETKIEVDIPRIKNEMSEYDYSSKQLKSLTKNKRRNKVIINTIKNEVDKDNPCLVFSCSVEHNIILSAALNCKGIKSAHIDSKINKTERRKIVNDFKKEKYDVIINFGVLTTGFDAPRIKTVIISRPTTSIVLYSQMIGRGLRGPRVGGNKKCNIIDIRDNYLDFGAVNRIYKFFERFWE
ncbi:MAG: DEAD/DEAH box helicase [Halanaerobiales bacterium]|nr:DEAD/DEAH box helicase [Halanaerobiales bacterium]MCF8008217.1 DEAD/DEAH box helicase [Halanaerobiales bacterium]